MSDLYNAISTLCEKRGITVYKLCKDIEIRGSVLSDLNTGRKKGLSTDTLSKIADYFGVSIDELTGREQQKEKTPILTDKDKRDVMREVERIMGDLENSGDLMFDGVPMSPEAKESLSAAMKLGLQAARLKNKESYTPKKYRK